MPKALRPNKPGAVFHLTARTQGHEPWFTGPLRDRIAQFMADAIRESDARLLAFAIMPNHLHVVIQQGEMALERVMHPLLLRTALLVNGARGTEGHVFERRYRSVECHDPRYARDVLIYVSLNAVRAMLVGDPAHYRWTSHAAYADLKNRPLARLNALVDLRAGLQLFEPEGPPAARRAAYLRCLQWRLKRDAWLIAHDMAGDAGPPPLDPPDPNAQLDWATCYAPLFQDGVGTCPDERQRGSPAEQGLDLAGITLEVVAASILDGSAVSLDDIRGRSRKPAAVAARGEIACRAVRAGYARKEVAAHLGVTEQCVGYMLARHRRASDGGPAV